MRCVRNTTQRAILTLFRHLIEMLLRSDIYLHDIISCNSLNTRDVFKTARDVFHPVTYSEVISFAQFSASQTSYDSVSKISRKVMYSNPTNRHSFQNWVDWFLKPPTTRVVVSQSVLDASQAHFGFHSCHADFCCFAVKTKTITHQSIIPLKCTWMSKCFIIISGQVIMVMGRVS